MRILLLLLIVVALVAVKIVVVVAATRAVTALKVATAARCRLRGFVIVRIIVVWSA